MVFSAVLAVLLGMFTSGNTILFIVGYLASFVGAGGSLGYLLGGWKRAKLGIVYGFGVALLLPCPVMLLLWAYTVLFP
jgi:hypothetical protein